MRAAAAIAFLGGLGALGVGLCWWARSGMQRRRDRRPPGDDDAGIGDVAEVMLDSGTDAISGVVDAISDIADAFSSGDD
ncbi:MAG: hypothetical protein ACXU8N_11700 [Telluria sp.]